MTKSELRKWAKQIRSELDMEVLSSQLTEKLKNLDEYKSAKNILIFYPLENEVNLLSLLDDNSKTFYLPKIDGETLLCCPYNKGDKTCLSCYKTCEPLTDACGKDLINLAVIPALAVDKNRYRLGYGGGFYDRFLIDFKGYKVVCIPQKLVIDTICPDSFDIKADKIITEKDDI